MTKVALTREARADLKQIKDYIARDSTTAARRVVLDLRAAMEQLAEMPGKGHLRADLGDEGLRVWVVYSYLVVYRPETMPLQIVGIVSGYRDLPRLL